ncbi:riboflavin kinase [Teredinibacter franksiae]|uniref:riboflavin kinase n=1 Tax=Teredinibacter franksiae TaxID=2761453 RepID=UPI0028A73F19|nr:riboflavin kinase [Teredinibacter franksiae]
MKPTISGGRKPLLEVHILDVEASLYGECLHVDFKHKLRAEMRFDSLEQLKSQIAQDVESARSWFQYPEYQTN